MLNVKVSTLYFLLMSVFYFTSCCSTQNVSVLSSQVAPNNCRINATIVSIDKSVSGKLNIAKVKIDNIVKAGFGFKNPLFKDDLINVKFEFSISKTNKTQFPELKIELPGLKIGDKFTADIERVELLQLNNNIDSFEYRVFEYNIITNRD